MAALPAAPGLVKINAEEVVRSLDADAFSVGLMEELQARGALAVGVTRGGNEAILATKSGIETFKMPSVKVVSTLGCGDTVNAGIAVSLGRGNDLRRAFLYGLACGTANAVSSLPGDIDVTDVEGFYRELIR